MSTTEPEIMAELLSEELENKGYFNIISEDGKTLILYSCPGACSPIFIRIEESGMRIVIPLYAIDKNIGDIIGVFRESLGDILSYNVYELSEKCVGLEITSPELSSSDTDRIIKLIRNIQGALMVLEKTRKDVLVETDVLL
ncbi:MAG: hypothetical protein ACP5PL_03890 [Infirmifilum sp.]